MINLLSPTDKKVLRAARRNTFWSRYIFMIMALLVAVNIMLGFTLFFLQNLARDYESRIDSNERLSAKQYKDTKARADTFRKELATAKAIIDGETNYSAVIVAIARTTPSRCVLSSLSLNAQFFHTPRTFDFSCLGPPDILRLKTALEENTQYFDKVNIVTTTPKQPSPNDPYTVSISMSLSLNKPPKSEEVN